VVGAVPGPPISLNKQCRPHVAHFSGAGTGSAGGKLLVQDGAVPRLLQLLAHSKEPQRLADALLVASSHAPLHQPALLDDIRAAVLQVCRPLEE
jgi:hypothetical protein